jgi:hypothetical protein
MAVDENGVRPLSLEASLIVIVLSSLGLWAVICALAALVSAFARIVTATGLVLRVIQ